MINTRISGNRLSTLLLAIMTLTLLLVVSGCEKNAPIVYTTTGGFAEVTVIVDHGGERAAATPFTMLFTITIAATDEEIERELEVVDDHAQGLLEVPADTPIWLCADVEINGIQYHGEYEEYGEFGELIPITIGQGEVRQGLNIWLLHEEGR